MEDFLKKTKQNQGNQSSFDSIHVVLGNEACDLDSAVSAICYAFYLQQKQTSDSSCLIVPVMNIPTSQFHLRTETTFFFTKVALSDDLLTFRDQINLKDVYDEGRLKLTLVDHNVLTGEDSGLEDCVVNVRDHHVRERPDSQSVSIVIDLVGSCSTLVAEELLNDPDFHLDQQTALLLYGTILVDTINRSVEAGKITPRDEDVLSRLEVLLPDVSGNELFEEIQRAKFDISGLTNMEIFEKDLKMVAGGNMVIAMVSVTMDMEVLLQRPHIESDLENFSRSRSADVVVIMTLTTSLAGSPRRQIAVFSKNRIFKDQVADVLDVADDPNLDLDPVLPPFQTITIFQQHNVKGSRKKVMPILKAFLQGDLTPDVASKEFAVETQHRVSMATEGFSSLSSLTDSFSAGNGETPGEIELSAGQQQETAQTLVDFDPFGTSATVEPSHAETANTGFNLDFLDTGPDQALQEPSQAEIANTGFDLGFLDSGPEQALQEPSQEKISNTGFDLGFLDSGPDQTLQEPSQADKANASLGLDFFDTGPEQTSLEPSQANPANTGVDLGFLDSGPDQALQEPSQAETVNTGFDLDFLGSGPEQALKEPSHAEKANASLGLDFFDTGPEQTSLEPSQAEPANTGFNLDILDTVPEQASKSETANTELVSAQNDDPAQSSVNPFQDFADTGNEPGVADDSKEGSDFTNVFSSSPAEGLTGFDPFGSATGADTNGRENPFLDDLTQESSSEGQLADNTGTNSNGNPFLPVGSANTSTGSVGDTDSGKEETRKAKKAGLSVNVTGERLEEMDESDLFDKINTPDNSTQSSPFINSGISTPFGPFSGKTSSQNSRSGSRYPSMTQTPPHSLMDEGMENLNKDHTLPSFNSSEMVARIQKKKASLGSGLDHDLLMSESTGLMSTPYTPQNSFREDSLERFVKDHSLPSFNSSDMVQKIQEKRNSLHAGLDSLAGEGEEASVTQNPFLDPIVPQSINGEDLFPFTPQNSFVNAQFDQLARVNLPSMNNAETVSRVQEKQSALFSFENVSQGQSHDRLGDVSLVDFRPGELAGTEKLKNPFLSTDDFVPFTPQNSFSDIKGQFMHSRGSVTEQELREKLQFVENRDDPGTENPIPMERAHGNIADTGIFGDSFEMEPTDTENNSNINNSAATSSVGQVLVEGFDLVADDNVDLMEELNPFTNGESKSEGQHTVEVKVSSSDVDLLSETQISQNIPVAQETAEDSALSAIQDSVDLVAEVKGNDSDNLSTGLPSSDSNSVAQCQSETVVGGEAADDAEGHVQHLVMDLTREIIQTALDRFPDLENPSMKEELGKGGNFGATDSGLELSENPPLDNTALQGTERLPRKRSDVGLETDYLPNMDPLHGNLNIITSPSSSTIETDADREVVESLSFRKVSDEANEQTKSEIVSHFANHVPRSRSSLSMSSVPECIVEEEVLVPNDDTISSEIEFASDDKCVSIDLHGGASAEEVGTDTPEQPPLSGPQPTESDLSGPRPTESDEGKLPAEAGKQPDSDTPSISPDPSSSFASTGSSETTGLETFAKEIVSLEENVFETDLSQSEAERDGPGPGPIVRDPVTVSSTSSVSETSTSGVYEVNQEPSAVATEIEGYLNIGDDMTKSGTSIEIISPIDTPSDTSSSEQYEINPVISETLRQSIDTGDTFSPADSPDDENISGMYQINPVVSAPSESGVEMESDFSFMSPDITAGDGGNGGGGSQVGKVDERLSDLAEGLVSNVITSAIQTASTIQTQESDRIARQLEEAMKESVSSCESEDTDASSTTTEGSYRINDSEAETPGAVARTKGDNFGEQIVGAGLGDRRVVDTVHEEVIPENSDALVEASNGSELTETSAVEDASCTSEKSESGKENSSSAAPKEKGDNSVSVDSSEAGYVTRKEVFMTSAGRMSISIDSVVDLPETPHQISVTKEHDSIAEEDQPTELELTESIPTNNVAQTSREPSISSREGKERMKGMDLTEEWHEDPIPGMEPAVTDESDTESSDDSSDSEAEEKHVTVRPSTLMTGQKKRHRMGANADIIKKDSIDDLVEGVDDIPTPDDLDTPDDLEGEGELEWESMYDTPVMTPALTPSESLPEYSMEEEREEKGQFRKVEIAGKDYRVDMHVIEPYKKVLSHGGYYGDGLNAIILFSGCYLPDRGRRDYQYVMDNLFLVSNSLDPEETPIIGISSGSKLFAHWIMISSLAPKGYVISTLELLVAEDYMIVYFHGATPRRQMPSFGWLKRCYQMIDRRLRKNLKGLLLVHPTLWLKTVVMMTKPFISSKFSSKLRFVKTLQELAKIVPMEYIFVPEPVQHVNTKLKTSPHTKDDGSTGTRGKRNDKKKKK